MGFLYTPLSLWIAFGGWMVAACVLVLAGWGNPFKRLHDAPRQHVWLAVVVAMSVLWAGNAWLDDGTVIHLLGATLLVTLFGWPLALIGMAAITGLAAIAFEASWQGVGLTFLIFGGVPVGASAILQRACLAWLPRNPLIFIITQGFVSPACASIVTSIAALAVHVVLVAKPLTAAPAGYALSTLLLASGEAWFTGIATALIITYRPAWITTYDARRYRLGKPPL
ncbi:energy-coupling factor ABC transporter permease [Paraburkholderia hayleyella]|uniref:energy-coupling factor ABC transporter permease n=1 Tax=Paraburkholderia hayleyella TaxID=2152889 RepID=UPI001291F088|nr:energy-coupling factor ABC transporter permease [Paraburkholderia hayleyella]